MKPGVKTSEFYVTMLPVVIAGLVYSGIIPESDTDMLVSLAKRCYCWCCSSIFYS